MATSESGATVNDILPGHIRVVVEADDRHGRHVVFVPKEIWKANKEASFIREQLGIGSYTRFGYWREGNTSA